MVCCIRDAVHVRDAQTLEWNRVSIIIIIWNFELYSYNTYYQCLCTENNHTYITYKVTVVCGCLNKMRKIMENSWNVKMINLTKIQTNALRMPCICSSGGHICWISFCHICRLILLAGPPHTIVGVHQPLCWISVVCDNSCFYGLLWSYQEPMPQYPEDYDTYAIAHTAGWKLRTMGGPTSDQDVSRRRTAL